MGVGGGSSLGRTGGAGGAASNIRDAATLNQLFAALGCTLLEEAKMDSTDEDLTLSRALGVVRLV
jgi:hypothetical protein